MTFSTKTSGLQYTCAPCVWRWFNTQEQRSLAKHYLLWPTKSQQIESLKMPRVASTIPDMDISSLSDSLSVNPCAGPQRLLSLLKSFARHRFALWGSIHRLLSFKSDMPTHRRPHWKRLYTTIHYISIRDVSPTVVSDTREVVQEGLSGGIENQTGHALQPLYSGTSDCANWSTGWLLGTSESNPDTGNLAYISDPYLGLSSKLHQYTAVQCEPHIHCTGGEYEGSLRWRGFITGGRNTARYLAIVADRE